MTLCIKTHTCVTPSTTPTTCAGAHAQAEFERRADPNDPAASELLEQMRAYVSKVG